MTDIRTRIRQEAEARAQEVVELTQALVRIASVNPPGAFYPDCAALIGERMGARGFTIETIRAEGALADSESFPRTNVIASTGSGGPCVHFNSHYDVVPVGEGWTVDPFGAEIIDGRVYGRGTCDMKGGLAASIIAAEVLKDIGHPGRIEVSGVVDEESGGFAGAAWLAEQGRFHSTRQDHVIIPEPFSPHRISIGHRGVWWGEVETRGRIAHGSMPFLGHCAVRDMGVVLDRIENDLIPVIGQRQTKMPCVPDGARRSTLNIASMHGGQPELSEGFLAPNVPDRARMVFDRRFLAEESLDEVKAEMVALLDKIAAERPGFDYTLRDLFEVHPTLTDETGPVVTATARVIEEVTGKRAEIVCSPGTYDQKHFDKIGGVTDCIAYGPGQLELAHQPDEYVEIKDLTQSAVVMALAAYDLLTRGG